MYGCYVVCIYYDKIIKYYTILIRDGNFSDLFWFWKILRTFCFDSDTLFYMVTYSLRGAH